MTISVPAVMSAHQNCSHFKQNFVRLLLLLLIAALPVVASICGWNPAFFLLPLCIGLAASGRENPILVLGCGILYLCYPFQWLLLLLLAAQPRTLLSFVSKNSLFLVLFVFDAILRGCLVQRNWVVSLSEFYCFFALASSSASDAAHRWQTRWFFGLVVGGIVLALLLANPHLAARVSFAFNPNVDAALFSQFFAALGFPFVALACALIYFRSRSAVLLGLIFLLPYRPTIKLFVACLIAPLILQVALSLGVYDSVTPAEGFSRFMPQIDDSAVFHFNSVANGVMEIFSNPLGTLAPGPDAAAHYLQSYGIFPHNAFLYAVHTSGFLHTAALLILLFSIYRNGDPLHRKILLGWVLFCGFSDLGMDIYFFASLFAAQMLKNQSS
ncbi:hypothetical protein [Herbaspirillum sp.]|uniref:hypothetical protein n=1 Tax=Herbaspirillum sp. TaxID=1890675 RepID=UPI0031D336A1